MAAALLVLAFFHLAGIIIGLGAVTVIDSLGFLARTSREWTQVTVRVHHVTKPLIWIGTALVAATWVPIALLYSPPHALLKSVLLVFMVANGVFLSFWVSPRVDTYDLKAKLFAPSLVRATVASMLVSFVSWWTFVALTVIWLLGPG